MQSATEQTESTKATGTTAMLITRQTTLNKPEDRARVDAAFAVVEALVPRDRSFTGEVTFTVVAGKVYELEIMREPEHP